MKVVLPAPFGPVRPYRRPGGNDGYALLPQRLDDAVRLILADPRIVVALRDEERPLHAVDEEDRRAVVLVLRVARVLRVAELLVDVRRVGAPVGREALHQRLEVR